VARGVNAGVLSPMLPPHTNKVMLVRRLRDSIHETADEE
jgi:hypothetical protein